MPESRQRIDRWLFFARFVKSRTLAAKLVQAGRVRVNGQKAEQPANTVRAGDVLTVMLERRILVCRVIDTGSRRGPAEEARRLYEDLSPPAATGPALPDQTPAVRELGSGRPTKRERRQIDRLRGD